MGLRGSLSCFALTAVAILAPTSLASGAELTKTEYVARAEAICKATAAQATPVLKDGLSAIKKNQVVGAGAKILKVAALNDSSRSRLLTIPKPQADVGDLTAWLKRLQIQNLFLRQAGKALLEAHRVQAQGDLSRFVHNGNLANDQVLGFGFKYCLFNSHLK
jgi:hypothetical protein